MEHVIAKADILIEALPYIQKFRGDTIVVKFGGSAMEDRTVVANVLKDVAFMACVGMRPVIVHGGGKAISKRMKEAGIAPAFVQGLRVTDEPSIRIVEHVLNQEINRDVVQQLQEMGCKARGIHGEDILQVRKHVGRDRQTGAPLDWGFVGEVTGVDVEMINAFLRADIVPVVTPLGRGGEDRHIYNINADEAATAIATRIEARKLVFLSDVPGILGDPKDPSTVISTLKLEEVEDLIRRGVISGGMLPKIEGAVKAIHAGVRKTHIVDAALPHSLLLELFTDRGVGTEMLQ